MEEKIYEYEKNNIIVKFQEDPFAITIITPIMQRAHSLNFAKDIAFVDSTASCDSQGHSVTFMLTACGIGAVPLAVMITKGQSSDDYIAAFNLLKEAVPLAFCSQGYPLQFITDDSEAERQALQYVWPDSKSLLCRFHICQSVWRWLFEKKHNIDAADRKILYGQFQACLQAPTIEEAEIAFEIVTGILSNNDAYNIVTKYPQWINYMNNYWKRKELWCIAFRDESMHGHHTNNFSEVNVRIFKDIVLSRNKAYNAVALVDFICTSMEEYYTRRLRNFVNGRHDTARLLFEDQLSRSAYITKDLIESIGDNLYRVIKEHGLSDFYEVNTAVGYCSCIKGKFGSFCKHQAAVFNFYKDKMPNLPSISSESRYLLAKLAFGDAVQEKEFYMPLVPNITHNLSESEIAFDCLPSTSTSTSNTIECPDDTVINDNINMNLEIIQNENLAKEYKEKICSLISNNFSKYQSTSLPILSKCIQRLENVKTATGWDSFLATAGSSISLRHRSRASIRVQPTTVSRRKPGITRGSQRLPVGRPVTGIKKKKIVKRKRNLQENVNLNIPNAKSHGTNH